MAPELISAFTPSTMSAELLEEIFVKREPLADDIVTSIAEAVLQPPGRRDLEHHLVVGPRGIGKTHLLTIVANRLVARTDLAGRVIVARLREEEWGVSTVGELLEQVVRQLAAEDQPDVDVRLAAAAEIAGLASTPIDELEDSAAQAIASAAPDRLVVIAVENVDELFDSLGTDEEHALRARLQNDRNLVLLASTPSLGSSISSRSGLWFGFFDIEHLDELDVDEARDLLLRLVRLGHAGGDPELIEFLGSEVATDRLRVVQQVVGGHPRLWMLMADCITTQRLDEVVGLIVAVLDDLTPYYQSQMKALSGQQRKIVVELTRRPGAVTVGDLARATRIGERVAAKQLGDLSKLGYVRLAELPEGVEVADKRQRRYELREPLLRHSLEHKESRGRPLTLIVEFLRAWFDQATLASWASDRESPRSTYAAAALGDDLVADPSKLFERGFEALVRHDYEVAAGFFEVGLKKNPGSSAALALLGSARGELGQVQRSLEASEKALRLAPHNSIALYNRGVALIDLSRYEEALVAFDSCLESDPDSVPALVNRGHVLIHLGRPFEALEPLDRALNLEPSDHDGMFNRADALRAAGRLEDALASFSEQLNRSPGDDIVLAHRALTLAAMGRPAEALDDMDAAINAQLAAPWLWRRIAIALDADLPVSVEDFVAALDASIDSPHERREIDAVARILTEHQSDDVRARVGDALVGTAGRPGGGRPLEAAILRNLSMIVDNSVRLTAVRQWFSALAIVEASPFGQVLEAIVHFGDTADGSAFLRLPPELRDVAYELAGIAHPPNKLRLRARP